jgi:hypothetical protein
MSGQPFVLHPPTLGSAWSGTQAQNLSRAVGETTPVADGNVFNRLAAITSEELRFSLTGLDTVGGLALSTVTGAAISGAVLYLAAMGPAGAKLGNGEHVTYTIGTGLLYPVRMTAAHGQNASLTLELIGYESAGARPDTIDASDDLSVNVGGAAVVYTLGPVVINGTTISDKLMVDVEFGIVADTVGTDSDIGTKFAFIRQATPRIIVSTMDQGVASTIGRALATSGNGVEVWFRKRVSTGFSTSTDHHKLTMASALIVPVGIQGDPHVYSFRCTGQNTAGTANPIASSTAAVPT